MSVPIAFCTVIIVWATIPLMLKWSAIEIDPFAGIFFRMIVASIFGLILLSILRLKLAWHRQAIKYYLVTNIGFSIGMTLVYVSAQTVSSGIISLMFGLTPLIASFLGTVILKEPRLSLQQWGSFLLAFLGLSFVISTQQSLDMPQSELLGLGILSFAVLVFCFSSVLLKSIHYEAHPLSKTVGSILLSVPYTYLIWMAFGTKGEALLNSPLKGWFSIIYLGIFGSLAAMVAYFHILRFMSPSKIGLANLVAPVVALWLGNVIEDEPIGPLTLFGAALVLLGTGTFMQYKQRPIANTA